MIQLGIWLRMTNSIFCVVKSFVLKTYWTKSGHNVYIFSVISFYKSQSIQCYTIPGPVKIMITSRESSEERSAISYSLSLSGAFSPWHGDDLMKESWGRCGAFSSPSHIRPEPWAGQAHHLPPYCLLLVIDVKQMPSFSCLLSLACSSHLSDCTGLYLVDKLPSVCFHCVMIYIRTYTEYNSSHYVTYLNTKFK